LAYDPNKQDAIQDNDLNRALTAHTGTAGTATTERVVSIKGKLRASSMPYTYDIAEGHIPGHISVNKFGHNSDIAGTLETVWSAGGLYPWMTVADQLEVLSGDNDDGAGALTGALTLELFGLDGSYNVQTETVILTGTTFVTTTNSYIRFFRGIVRSAGVSGWNEGIITIRDQDTNTTRGSIEALKNQTLMAVFTIPAGNVGFITSWYVGSVTSKDSEFELYIRPFGEVFQVKRNVHLVGSAYISEFDFPEMVPEKSDIEIRGLSSGGGGNVSAGFFLWYEEE